jgi:WD40 repeat protein
MVYKEAVFFETAIRRNEFTCLTINESVNHLQFFQDKIYTVSNKKIAIRDIDGNPLEEKAEAHTEQINCIKVAQGKDGQLRIYTGGIDKTIRIWNSTLELQAKCEGHTGTINDLEIEGQRLFSASDDTTIAIWDIITFTHLTQLTDLNAPLQSLTIAAGKIFARAKYGLTGVWDVKSYKFLGTIDTANEILNMKIYNNEIYCRGRSDIISVLDLDNYKSKKAIILSHLSRGTSYFDIYNGKIFVPHLVNFNPKTYSIQVFDVENEESKGTIKEICAYAFNFQVRANRIFCNSICKLQILKSGTNETIRN